MQTMADIEKAINAFRGVRIKGQRGRKLQYALCQTAHTAVAPDGFIVVFLGSRSRNTLTFTQEKARDFLEELKSISAMRG